MNTASTSSAGAPAAPLQSTPTKKASDDDGGITPVQMGLAALILGASAGLTMYTKKASHMLNQLERASKNATQRKGPPKFGPKTKAEWEKTRNRWDCDDL